MLPQHHHHDRCRCRWFSHPVLCY
ncbi:hypothetical protein O9993_14470 [Vibrio lentus]|nr:hypothetical protein [Vibrio lentus]